MKKIFKQSLMAMLMATVFFSMNVPTVLAEEPPSYHSRIMFAIGETANPPGSDLAETYNSQYSDQGTKGDEFGDPQNAKDEGYQYEAFQRELSAGRLGDSRNFAEYMYTRGVKWNTRSITFAPDAVANFSFVQTRGHIDYERYDLNARILQYKQACRDEFTSYFNSHKDEIMLPFLDQTFPVGTIIYTYNSSETTTTLHNRLGGTWEAYNNGFHWAVGDKTSYSWTNASGQASYGSLTINATGGYANVALVTTQIPSHTHASNNHNHKFSYLASKTLNGNGWRVRGTGGDGVTENKWFTNYGGVGTAANGSGTAHNHMPQYVIVHAFRRKS